MGKLGKCLGRVLLLAVAFLPGGCRGGDAENLARVGRKLVAKLQPTGHEATGKLSGGLGCLRASLDDSALDRRVTSRLRWDRNLASTPIEVRSLGNGVVELRGTVADLGLRQRAVQLAESTVGVEGVTDVLIVGETGP